MKLGYLSTTDIARAVGVHPNTVRMYEKWGLLPAVPRSSSGYRLFTEAHLDQMRLARLAYVGPYPGTTVRRSADRLVRRAASGDLGGALEQAYGHLALIKSEQTHAEAAVRLLERWAQGKAADATDRPLQIKDVARLMDLTTDTLRTWEREGLLRVPRSPSNGYRQYGPREIGRLRVIRMLRQSGYSTMSILRILLHLDRGLQGDLRQVLDTPGPDEDVMSAADRLLSTLAEQETLALQMISLLEEMIHKQNNR